MPRFFGLARRCREVADSAEETILSSCEIVNLTQASLWVKLPHITGCLLIPRRVIPEEVH